MNSQLKQRSQWTFAGIIYVVFTVSRDPGVGRTCPSCWLLHAAERRFLMTMLACWIPKTEQGNVSGRKAQTIQQGNPPNRKP